MDKTPGSLSRRAAGVLAVAGMLAAYIFLGALGSLGERTNREVASAQGWTMTVEYPAVTYPGLTSHLRIALEPPVDFGGPVDLAFDRTYWDQFEVVVEPPPLAVAADADTVRLTFVIPLGEILLVDATARLEGDAPESLEGRLAALVHDTEVVSLDCRTAVLP